MNVPPVDTEVMSVIAPDEGARSPTTLVEDSSLADWWFAALDQRRIWVGCELRAICVMSVHVRRVDVWIQVEVEGEPRSLVLHVQPGAGADEAVEAIGAMIQRSERQRAANHSLGEDMRTRLPITSLSA